MWFSDEMRSAYNEAILPAIRAAGYEAVRMDQVEHVEIIDDRMVAEIKESRFLVAEFTGHMHGVYFGAGLALGLGLPVIWVCRDQHFSEAHFDTSHFNHVVWKTPADLREKLETRIKAIVGLGPGAAPAEAATAPDQG